MVTGIVEGLRWLGLDWDEGPDVGGPFAPYFQSQRLDRHRAMAETLVASGRAYYCYCPPDAIRTRREEAEARGEAWRYDRRCLSLPPERIAEYEAVGAPRAVRFLVPAGKTGFDDLVHGRIEFDHEHIEDFVVLRSDGLPTYQLSVVADDIDMQITRCRPRRRSHLEYAQAAPALRGARCQGAAVCACAPDSRPRSKAPQQASWRDVGHRLSRSRVSLRSHGELSRAARVVAGRRPRGLHHARAHRALLARRHQRRERHLRSRQAGLFQRAAHCAASDRRGGAAGAADARSGRAVARQPRRR